MSSFKISQLYESKDMKKIAKFWIDINQPDLLDKVLASVFVNKNKKTEESMFNALIEYEKSTNKPEIMYIIWKYKTIYKEYDFSG